MQREEHNAPFSEMTILDWDGRNPVQQIKMGKNNFKQDKGVAGLTILLSLIVMLFIIGLIVMIFALMSSSLQTSTYTSTAKTVTNETVLQKDAGTTIGVGYRNAVCNPTAVVVNATGNVVIASGNYTLSSTCSFSNATQVCAQCGKEAWKVTYSLTYDADNTATETINDTSTSIGSVTDWFDIFIVIGAMVVLILLTVVIITAIRSSGMIAESGSTQGAEKVGTA